MNVAALLATDAYVPVNKHLIKKVWLLAAAYIGELLRIREYFRMNEKLGEDWSFFWSDADMADMLWYSTDTVGRLREKVAKLWLIECDRRGVPCRIFYIVKDANIYDLFQLPQIAETRHRNLRTQETAKSGNIYKNTNKKSSSSNIYERVEWSKKPGKRAAVKHRRLQGIVQDMRVRMISLREFRNTLAVTEEKTLVSEAQKWLIMRMAVYSDDDIKQSMQNYADILHSDQTYRHHKWSLSEFLNRKNGMPVFIHKKIADYDKAKFEKMNDRNRPRNWVFEEKEYKSENPEKVQSAYDYVADVLDDIKNSNG